MTSKEDNVCPNCNEIMTLQSFISDIVLLDTIQSLCPECGYYFELETAN